MLLTIVTVNGNSADVDFDPDCDLNDFGNITELVAALKDAVMEAKGKDEEPDYEEPDDDPGADLAQEMMDAMRRPANYKEPRPGDDPP